jgi:hypothetical protein
MKNGTFGVKVMDLKGISSTISGFVSETSARSYIKTRKKWTAADLRKHTRDA